MSANSVWKEAVAANGRVYYYHTATKETRWDKPVELGPTGPTPAHAWRKHQTPDGRTYYEDTIHHTTTWEEPEVLKTANGARDAPAAPSHSSNGNPDGPSSDANDAHENQTADRPATIRELAAHQQQQANDDAFTNLQDAETAFFNLLKRVGVEADWTWEQTVKAAMRDPAYRAFQDPKDRKEAWKRYIAQVEIEERDREKERQAKLREDFRLMLQSHPEITYYTRWSTARPILQSEMAFKAAKHEDERIQLFNNYRAEEYKAHIDQEAAEHKAAVSKINELLPTLTLSAFSRWTEAYKAITQHDRFRDDGLQSLSKVELIKAWETYQKDAERAAYERRQERRFIKQRQERQNRDAFIDLMNELRRAGKIKANTRWSDIKDTVEADARYEEMLGQPGSTPLELFWDAVEEEDRALRVKRNLVYDVLEAQQYEMTTKTNLEEFNSVMEADERTATLDKGDLRLIYDRLLIKVQEREDKERAKAERHHRYAIDDLRSRIKRLSPPVHVDDSWDKVRPRLEKYEEYRALESDELRRSAFEKHIRRLKEREEDDRRKDRNGHPKRRRTATPEIDAYEAERRKAQAERERMYGKRGIPGVSPPPRRELKDWDNIDHYNGRDNSSRRLSGNHYDRDRRDRETERERSYLSRADPRDRTVSALDYDDDQPSRRRRDSEGSMRSNKVSYNPSKWPRIRFDDWDIGMLSQFSQRLKRHEGDTPSRSKTPVAKKEPEQGFHSGSEEGEIEED